MEQQEQQIQLVTAPARKRVAPALIPVLALAALVALTACGGGGGPEEEAATTPAGESPTPGVAVDGKPATPEGPTPAADASPTAATTLPEISSLCDLVTPEDVEDALDDSVTDGTESTISLSCGYALASGNSVNLNLGSQEDFETGVFRTGDLGEPVPGIGDEAAWFGGDLFGDQGTLSVGQGDFYFQLRMNLPGVDLATQLEVAKGLATRAVERIP